MTGHDYDEMARLSALQVEAERRRSLSTEPRERIAAIERAKAMDAGRYVRPLRDEDDHGPEMLTAVACIGAVVLVVLTSWVLWASGVLS